MAYFEEGRVIWRRFATPRLAASGIRKDGSIRTKCVTAAIISSVIIEPSIFNAIGMHITGELQCFSEFLMENVETNDIMLAEKYPVDFYVNEEIDEFYVSNIIIGSEINSRTKACDHPKWKLFYILLRSMKVDSTIPEKYSYVYKLIFSFKTGTLDEFSCAMICNLYLKHLDHAIRNVPLVNYSFLKMYDGGFHLDDRISNFIRNLKKFGNYSQFQLIYRTILEDPCSNFSIEKKSFENIDSPFVTIRYYFSDKCTKNLNKNCVINDVSVYVVIITSVVNTLFRFALKNGFIGSFRARILNDINARFILEKIDKKKHYRNKLGSYMIPFIYTFLMNSIELSDIFVEARKADMSFKTFDPEVYWMYEAIKQISIREAGWKYRSGNWSPEFFFRFTDLSDVDSLVFKEHTENSFLYTAFERSSSPLECTYFNVVYYTFKDKIAVSFDLSNEYFTDLEMITIVQEFSQIIETLSSI